MPLTPEQEASAETLLKAGALASDPPLRELLLAVEPDLLAALGSGHPMAGDQSSLHRFLVARKLKIEPTVTMIQDHIKWRAENLPIAPTGQVLVELKKGKAELLGTDKQGRPMVIIRSGKFDPKTRDLNASVLSIYYLFEEALKMLPEGQTQFAVMYDREGFSPVKHWDYALLKAVFTQLSDNYPERLGAAYVYPSGKVIPWLWGMIKGFLDPRTRAKVHMIEKAGDLLDAVPSEFVPTHAGGTSTHVFDPNVFDAPLAKKEEGPTEVDVQ